MIRLQHVRLGAAALVAAGSALMFVPTPATAASLAQSAWWYRAKTTTPTAESPQAIPGGNPTVPTLPVGPPSVGAEQLHVEGAPTGATGEQVHGVCRRCGRGAPEGAHGRAGI